MSLQKSSYLLFVTACLFCACNTNTRKTISIEGQWQSIGYGRILDIQSDLYSMYDITQISCLPIKEGSMSEYERDIEFENDTLSIKEGFDVYYFSRLDKLPPTCGEKLAADQLTDPVYNFEVFAKTFEEHYAYFELNNISWGSFYSFYKSKITSSTTDVELYLVLEEMIDSLHDNHGYIEPTDEVYELAEQQTKETEETDQLEEYGDFVIAKMVADTFLDENLTRDSWIVKWGTMENNIGYVQVNAMMLFADINLSDGLVEENGFVSTYFEAFQKLSGSDQVEKEVKGIGVIMDNVMDDLSKTQLLIVDVRFNGGGNDDVGLEVLRRFNQERHQVGTKKARVQNSFTKEIPIFLEAAENPYTKPVYLLTSQQSASATDFMVMSSLGLDHINRIGSHTQGALSDALGKKLPNGWDFSLSNEVYLDNQGVCYESIGIPVNYELSYPNDRQTFFRSVADDLEGDKLRILKAIEELKAE